VKKSLAKIVLAAFGATFGAALAFGLAFAAAPSVYQTGVLILTSLVGTEYVTVDNGGPRSTVVPVNLIRNAVGYSISAATSGTLVMTTATSNLLLTGAVGTMTVDLPPSPEDGALFSLNNVTGSNFSGTITLATTDSSTIANSLNTAVNIAAGGSQEWQYTAASAVWYRLR
jgi:hypothetical protein